MQNNKPRTIQAIRTLKSKANKGDFKAARQLHEYYRDGKYVQQSDEVSKKYFSKIKEIVSTQKLCINSLLLENYRIFKAIDLIEFDRNLSVLVGNNGAGKTTLLDAVADSIALLRSRILHTSLSMNDVISENDITIGSQNSYTSVQTRYSLNDRVHFDLELVKKHLGTSLTNKKSKLSEVTEIGDLYKELNDNDSGYNFPILSYYTVSRSLDINRRDISSLDETSNLSAISKFAGYENSLSGRADFKEFFRWFKRIDDIEKHRQTNEANSEIPTYIIEQLRANLSGEEANVVIDNIRKNNKINNREVLNEEPSHDVQKVKKIINIVIEQFMEGFTNLRVVVEPFISLVIDKNGQELSVLQLSQGEKSLLALLLDITRRLILLNPSLPNPLDGHGIILIDEIDLHLHPSMQRKVIINLSKIFKNCQFIVSTHSPQIISEVEASKLIVLFTNDDGNIDFYSPEISLGLTSNDILNNIMNNRGATNQLVRNEEVHQELIRIEKLIASGDPDSINEASSAIVQLEELTKGEIPELVRAKLEIELSDWDD